MIVLAIVIGIATFGSSLLVDWLAHGIARPIYFSDVLTGCVASVFSGGALFRLQVRRRQLQARMQIIEDVNHHVRNALTAIVLSTALRDDPELNALVRDAGERIDWVLSDVLSRAVKESNNPQKRSRWNPGLRLEHRPGKPSVKQVESRIAKGSSCVI